MTYPITFREDARRDILSIHDWYESRSEGVGEEFLEDLDFVYSNLRRFPEMYSHVSPRIRRAFTRKFPYAIFYYFDNNEILILGCRHMHQHPDSWPKL